MLNKYFSTAESGGRPSRTLLRRRLHCISIALACLTLLGAADPVEGIEGSREFSLLTYNVHGLFRLAANDNPRDRSPTIGWLARSYDLVLLQEDFEYHRLISSQLKHTKVFRGNRMGLDPRLVTARILLLPFVILFPNFSPPYGAGLTTFVQKRMGKSVENHREAFDYCASWFGTADCWATKGYLMVRVRLENGSEVDIYNTHLEAGSDAASIEVRRLQLNQLSTAIRERSAGRAVILGADVNAAYYRPSDREMLRGFREDLGLHDSGAYASNPHWRERDALFYRSGESVQLEVIEAGEDLRFVSDNRALSDHPALYGRFRIEGIAPNRREGSSSEDSGP